MNDRTRLALLLVGMFNFATALMVVDEIIGASTSGESTYAWPSASLGKDYFIKLGIHQSWEICFVWIVLSVALMLYAVSRERIQIKYAQEKESKGNLRHSIKEVFDKITHLHHHLPTHHNTKSQ